MLAYLTVLYDPYPPRFVGVEEPESFLHPRLLRELGEECRQASERTQLLVTTHSPYFLDACRAREVRVLYRDEQGFTQVHRASDIAGIDAFIEAGASLGHLWMEGQFGMSDPLKNQGAPASAPLGGQVQVINRIAVEELEAWFFGDWAAVRAAYGRLDAHTAAKAPYRNCDGIAGGTWEAMERELQKRGYFGSGLRKIEFARSVARHMIPAVNRSHSFCVLRDALAAM